jgi:tetratricopeptide (TPR) repeat protein
VNRQQTIIAAGAAVAVVLLFVFGRTTPNHTHEEAANPAVRTTPAVVGFDTWLEASKKKCSPAQLSTISRMEKSLENANTAGKIHQFHLLADYWKDSVGDFVPYINYLSASAKLENSEKNLTFAAHLMLAELPSIEEPGLRTWMATEARTLFEKAKQLNPGNDSTSIGLGSCYFFGGGGSEPPMKGIALIRDVAEKNPDNIYAQFMLGIGASISGQTEKAIERFNKVVALDQDHLEARLRLADLLVQKGDKALARKQYAAFVQTVKRLEAAGSFKGNPDMIRQIEAYIETLK